MRISLLRKSVAWWVFFTITAMFAVPMMLLPVPLLGLLVGYPAYYAALKIVLLTPEQRKAPVAFWMPASINVFTLFIVSTIFASALFRLLAPIFEFITEIFALAWPMVCCIPASYICFLLTVPDVADHNFEIAADDATGESGTASPTALTNQKSFLNKYTANDDSPS